MWWLTPGTLQHHRRLLLPCLNGNMHYSILHVSISIATRERALKGVYLAYFCFGFSPLVVRLDFVTILTLPAWKLGLNAKTNPAQGA